MTYKMHIENSDDFNVFMSCFFCPFHSNPYYTFFQFNSIQFNSIHSLILSFVFLFYPISSKNEHGLVRRPQSPSRHTFGLNCLFLPSRAYSADMALPSFLKYAFVWTLPLVSACTWLGQSLRNPPSTVPLSKENLLKWVQLCF